MVRSQAQEVVFVTSPLEEVHVRRMRDLAGNRVEIIFEPDLLPPVRYVADHTGPDSFQRTPEQEARFSEHLRRSSILLDFPKNLPAGTTLEEAAPQARWVQTTSAGVGQLVASLGLEASDIIVTTASGVHARPLTEFVFMALLQHVKELDRLRRDQEARRWDRFCSDELDGKTMAIIGPGRIGRQVAAVARSFGMRVLAMGRTSNPVRAAELGVDAVYPRDGLSDMLSEADAVVLCCPHTPDTEGLIDSAAISSMKPGVMFVNISRGPVVDEAALLQALQEGRIAFAALDVFTVEPLPADSPFWALPNVLINPHSASTAFSENGKIIDIFCHNLECFLDGRYSDMRNVLDKARMY